MLSRQLKFRYFWKPCHKPRMADVSYFLILFSLMSFLYLDSAKVLLISYFFASWYESTCGETICFIYLSYLLFFYKGDSWLSTHTSWIDKLQKGSSLPTREFRLSPIITGTQGYCDYDVKFDPPYFWCYVTEFSQIWQEWPLAILNKKLCW